MSEPPPPTRTASTAHANPTPEGSPGASSVQQSDRITVRFQTAPGMDGAVMVATNPIRWELSVTATEDTSFGINPAVVINLAHDSGTIAAGANIEIALDRNAIDFSYHNEVRLTIWWEENAPTVYKVFWNRIEVYFSQEFSAENRLGSLGYYTGHLLELPMQDQNATPNKDQAILNFQADNGLELDGQNTATLRTKLTDVTGDHA